MKFLCILILAIASTLNITHANEIKGYLPMGSIYTLSEGKIDIGNPTWLTGFFIQRDLNNNIISVHAVAGSDTSWFASQFIEPTKWLGTFINLYEEFKAWANWDLAAVQSLQQNHTVIQLSNRTVKGEYWIGGIVSFILDATQIFADAFVLPDDIRGKVVESAFDVFTQEAGLLSDVSLALRENRLNDAVTTTLKVIYTRMYEKWPEYVSGATLVGALAVLSNKYGAEIVNNGTNIILSGLKSVEAFANGLTIIGKTGIYYINYYDGEFNLQAATIDLKTPFLPTIPTPSQTIGSWITTPQFLSVSANNAERIYCMVEETNDGTTPNDPPIPSETLNDPCVQGGSFITGASGQFQLWGETGKLKNIKIRFRAWNQQGFSSVSPVYNYSIDLRNQQTVTTPVSNKRISVGGYHSCALTSAGGVKCWGANGDGQLGDGTTTDRKTPVSVEGLSSGVAAVSAGHDHTCALTTAGAVKCWGYNIYGFLGDGSASPSTSPYLAKQTTPVLVQGLSSGIKAIAAGNHYTCALTNSGGVKCWGINGYATYNFSVLGDGTTMDRFSPVDVSGLSSGVVAIAAGHTHTCAVTNLGEIKCWGQNSYGQLGNGTTTNSTIPVTVSGLNNAISISVGSNYYSCAVTNLGEVKCWGYNGGGQLGNGGGSNSSTPTLVSNLNSAISVTAGSTVCALTNIGSAQCWSYARGDDNRAYTNYTPIAMPNLSTGVAEISSGYTQTCALMTSGGIKCFGSNQYGQLGNGTTTDSATPVDVVGF